MKDPGLTLFPSLITHHSLLITHYSSPITYLTSYFKNFANASSSAPVAHRPRMTRSGAARPSAPTNDSVCGVNCGSVERSRRVSALEGPPKVIELL